MSIVGPDGKQISEGPTGRAIVISEHIIKGKPCWGVEGAESIDILEALQVLSEVTRAIIVTHRQKIFEQKAQNQVRLKLDDLAKGAGEV
jgi:ABC-type ATPase involved in cell division